MKKIIIVLCFLMCGVVANAHNEIGKMSSITYTQSEK